MTNYSGVYGASNLAQGCPAYPRVTLALFAYNQQSFVRSAVEGALAQVYDGPLEIILSDDGSHDDTFAVMQDVAHGYAGPHHVRFNRNHPNLGLSAHVNRVIAMAQGEIIVMSGGDDISLPNRVHDTAAVFARHPDAMAVSFSDLYMDEAGRALPTLPPNGSEQIIDLEIFLAAGPRAQSHLRLSGASRAIRRTIYERFGELLPDCPAEDTPYLRRALYLGTCVRCGWPGIRYRIHTAQMSRPAKIARMNAHVFKTQYLADLVKLEESGITELPLMRIRTHIEAESVEFALRGLRQSGESPDLSLIFRILPAAGFPIREKLGLLKRFLLRRGLS